MADHSKRQAFVTSTRNAGIHSDFYSVHAEGHAVDSIEQQFSQIEAVAAASLQRLTEDRDDQDDRNNIFNLIALQATRGPIFRSRLEAMETAGAYRRRRRASDDYDAISRFLAQEDGSEPTLEQVSAFAEDLKAAQLAVDVPREYSILSALTAAADIFDQMIKLKLYVIKCDEVTFVTSDNPVLIPYAPSVGRPLSVEECGLCMSIDPHRVVFAVPRRPDEFINQTCLELRRRFAAAMKQSAFRFTFSHPDFADVHANDRRA